MTEWLPAAWSPLEFIARVGNASALLCASAFSAFFPQVLLLRRLQSFSSSEDWEPTSFKGDVRTSLVRCRHHCVSLNCRHTADVVRGNLTAHMAGWKYPEPHPQLGGSKSTKGEWSHGV